MTKKTSTDCCAEPDTGLISVELARQRMLDLVAPVTAYESLELQQSLGRTTAQSVLSTIDVPPFDNSAMDGYAIKVNPVLQGKVWCRQIGSSFAGSPFTGTIAENECIRIMTGAVIPEGSDAVIMQENVAVQADEVQIDLNEVSPGQNIRYAGEDLKTGATLLHPGKRLRQADIGLLASVGLNSVSVFRKLRVAILSTGDELRSVGQALKPGQIYDSNRYTLRALLEQPGIDVIDLGIIADDPGSIREAFSLAAGSADAIISSGGVSVGDADYVKEILEETGTVDFWRIAMKPGKPLAFGQIDQCIFFGLPGNPVSVMATYYQFALPALRKMMGQGYEPFRTYQANCLTALRKTPGRTDFQRGLLSQNESGQLEVSTTGGQGSHLLSSMSHANCFIILPAGSSDIEAGSAVTVQPFAELIY